MVTKSVIKAMKCPTYFGAYYLTPGAVVREIQSPMARVGTEFHRYRQEYTEHLADVGQIQDHEWLRQWLNSNAVMPETRELIAADAQYAVDPRTVVGCEIYFSVTRDFKKLEMMQGNKPGYQSENPAATFGGSIDLLEVLPGRRARITDWKSGWATSTVSDHEPLVYVALVFAHFPQVDTIEYKWEFPRVRAEKDGGTYTREDLPWIHSFLLGELWRLEGLRKRKAEGLSAGVDPYAGLCAFCELRCPLRESAVNAQLMIPPVQDEPTAKQVGSLLYAATLVASMARRALRPYLEARGPRLKLAEDWELELQLSAKAEYSLPDTLALLGIVIDQDALPHAEKGQNRGKPLTPKWDVPINSLTISASKLHQFAGARSRAGMRGELEAVAKHGVRSKVRVRRLGEGDERMPDEDEE